VHILDGHAGNDEVISNSFNPSTRPQLRKVAVERADEGEAVILAEERWNLHWLSTTRGVYVKSYQGKKSRRYILVKRGDRWLIWENTYKKHRGVFS
jgi:hypothetical protein